ncbi:MAG: phosphoribosylanthranilate isomerase [bacterium]|nr:phosphoribosylanthranilate isomerase [bacterium]
MRVKFCGVTNKQDALNAAALGVDALGFIFYRNSPRYVSPDVVEEISMLLPPFVMMVGVFVNHTKEEIIAIAEQCQLDLIQLHGDEPPELCLELPYRVIKAIRVGDPEDLDLIPKYQGVASALLLDTKKSGTYGGTGKTFDWGLALKAKEYDIPLILSGGIRVSNVSRAISLVNPYAIDISSGVEKEPGLKDYQKMQDLMRIANS